MRRENGTGTVVKLSGARRKPYAARITCGCGEDGRQIRKDIAHCATAKEAQRALEIYFLDQEEKINAFQKKGLRDTELTEALSAIQSRAPTLAEVYDRTWERKYAKLSPSSQRINASSWKKWISKLGHIQINKISVQDMQAFFEDMTAQGAKKSTLVHTKSLIKAIWEEAIREGIMSPSDDFMRYILLDYNKSDDDDEGEGIHKDFSPEEISLIAADGSREAHIVLIHIYTGARPVDLQNLSESNMHKEDGIRYIRTGKSKTKAGSYRVIPIHPAIESFYMDILDNETQYIDYRKKIFNPLMERLGIKGHLPYDTRHTFATIAKNSSMDPYARKKIMGHNMNDLTDDVYTHAYISKLYEEICKIPTF